MIGIYKFTNKYNNKIYIGKSKNIKGRYKGHIRESKNGSQSYFHRAIRKYGIDAFTFEVLIECLEENLDYWEKFYIKYYGSNNLDYGYNMTAGGDGHRATSWIKGLTKEIDERVYNLSLKCGHPSYGDKNGFYSKHHTEESKERNRQKHLNKKQSPETIQKRVNNIDYSKLRGRKRTVEQCKSISDKTKKAMNRPEVRELFLQKNRENAKNRIGCKYMNNGKERKLVKPEDFYIYIEQGYSFGRNILSN